LQYCHQACPALAGQSRAQIQCPGLARGGAARRSSLAALNSKCGSGPRATPAHNVGRPVPWSSLPLHPSRHNPRAISNLSEGPRCPWAMSMRMSREVVPTANGPKDYMPGFPLFGPWCNTKAALGLHRALPLIRSGKLATLPRGCPNGRLPTARVCRPVCSRWAG